MRIVIVTPAAAGTRLGNRRTAQRWAGILRSLGERVDIVTQWQGGAHDMMIALHAQKSRAALLAFKAAHPDRPLVLALTGTDLYRDIREDAQAAASLPLADRLVVLQAAALQELAPTDRAKTVVIVQSETASGSWRPPRRTVRFCVLGHLRAEKDPFLPVQALGLIDDPRVRLVQAGAALTPAFAVQARELMQAESRYHWRGELSRGHAMRLLRTSHALIVPSLMEGGAHVVSEAIVTGVPVLASDIPGNRGLLGDDYAGFFPVGDAAALTELMRRAAGSPEWQIELAGTLALRKPLFDPARETAAWRRLLGDLLHRSA